MIIQSSFKDYYDYLVNTYGRDEKVVYSRVPMVYMHYNHETIKYNDCLFDLKGSVYPRNSVKEIKVIVGNLNCTGFVFAGNFYFTKNDLERLILEISNIEIINKKSYISKIEMILKHDNAKVFSYKKDKYFTPFNIEISNKIGFLVPVVVIDTYKSYLNMKLSDLGIGGLILPDQAWEEIYNFLIQTPEVIDNRTDLEKVQSHGFDKKISFRKDQDLRKRKNKN